MGRPGLCASAPRKSRTRCAAGLLGSERSHDNTRKAAYEPQSANECEHRQTCCCRIVASLRLGLWGHPSDVTKGKVPQRECTGGPPKQTQHSTPVAPYPSAE